MKNLYVFILGVALVFGGVTASFADSSGTFTGQNNHITTGGVTVVKHADGSATVTLGDDFSLDGAPDWRT